MVGRPLARTIPQLAHDERGDGQNDLVPFWVFQFDGGHHIDPQVSLLPLSREWQQSDSLRCTIAAYRLVLGQPRQEDLVEYLRRLIETDPSPERLLDFRIDLRPAAVATP